jgi:CreA protein
LTAWPVISPSPSAGIKGWIGVAEEVSDISLACRQIGPIHFKAKFSQGEDVFRKRRSLFFKKMQIVRGCDTKRNVLVLGGEIKSV